MSQRKINFNAGPATLPVAVLSQYAEAVMSYGNTGLSVLELPHRGKEFLNIIEESKALLRELCGIGDEYEILWLQGGGRMLFSMIPMNFLKAKGAAGYIDSGHWATEAIEYSEHYGATHILGSSKGSKYNHLPAWPSAIPADLSYLHITTNNTIYGTQYHNIPTTNVPLIGDMSSDILSGRRDYSKYAMFYAAAQKNLGTPGVALVGIHKDFLAQEAGNQPPMLSFKAHVKENSILNTANVSGIYCSLLMLRWIKAKGINNIEAENARKATMLYDVINASPLFTAHVPDPSHRSLMNVCFTAKDAATEQALLDICSTNNITGIQGHRAVGGFRVSLYNSVTEADTALLAQLMRELETKS